MKFSEFDRPRFSSHVHIKLGIEAILHHQTMCHGYALRLHRMVSRVVIAADLVVVEVCDAPPILLNLHFVLIMKDEVEELWFKPYDEDSYLKSFCEVDYEKYLLVVVTDPNF